MSRQSVFGLAVVGVMLAAGCLAAPAAGACGHFHADFVPGNQGLACFYGDGLEETWTVPPKITKPELRLYGADDATGGSGGRVRVKMPVISGETLEIDLGGNGAASSIGRNGEPLLVAGGGDGKEPNYVSPEAELIEVEEPGQPPGEWIGNGAVSIEWYDRRDPIDIVDPLPSVIFDFFDTENVGFPYTGGYQSWTVPKGVERATFELWGGHGESGEPRGHVLAGYEVTPGETFGIQIGGPGEDTTLNPGWVLAMAAGGDTERPNYVFPPDSLAQAVWEGGGTGSQAGNGYAVVHFRRLQEAATQAVEQRDSGTSGCVVPKLTGRKPTAARSALAKAGCRLGAVSRRPTGLLRRGRVVRQLKPAGVKLPLDSPVGIVIGKRP
jgi:PASTA domain-containing protein